MFQVVQCCMLTLLWFSLHHCNVFLAGSLVDQELFFRAFTLVPVVSNLFSNLVAGRRPLFFPHGQEKVVVPSLIGSSCFVFDWDADQWSGSKKTRRDVEAHPQSSYSIW